MTQRSAQRWNTGKRGAAQRKIENSAPSLDLHRCPFKNENLAWNLVHFDSIVRFPHSPRLAQAFRRGVWRNEKSQPVEF